MTALAPAVGRALSAVEFQGPSEVPPAPGWVADLDNARTHRAYRSGAGEFSAFVGLARPEGMRRATRAHAVAWRALGEQRPGRVREPEEALGPCPRSALSESAPTFYTGRRL